MSDQDRTAFEHWMSDEGQHPKAVERVGGEYRLMQAQSSWIAWQAACAYKAKPPADDQARRDAVDARRYRWLRSQNVGPNMLERVYDDHNPPYITLKFGEELDAAIDTAQAASAEVRQQ